MLEIRSGSRVGPYKVMEPLEEADKASTAAVRGVPERGKRSPSMVKWLIGATVVLLLIVGWWRAQGIAPQSRPAPTSSLLAMAPTPTLSAATISSPTPTPTPMPTATPTKTPDNPSEEIAKLRQDMKEEFERIGNRLNHIDRRIDSTLLAAAFSPVAAAVVGAVIAALFGRYGRQ